MTDDFDSGFDSGFDASLERRRRRDSGLLTDAPEPAAPAVPAPRRAGHGHRRKPGRRKRVLTWTAIGVASTVLLSAAGIYIYVKVLDSNIHAEALHSGGTAPKTVAEKSVGGQSPINVLIIGSDSRDNSEDLSLGGSQDSVGGPAHADVEMLLHISADRTNASITSIPRDTWVKIHDCDGKQHGHTNITDSLAYTPSCVVDTWEDLTHVQIDHFVMLDFSGVVKMADAVGGVQVCTKENVADYGTEHYPDGTIHHPGSHLVLPAGTHTIYGIQALEWLRTRHAFEDGSDIGRTKAQHLYLNSMLRKMKSANTLLDLGKLNSLAQTAVSALTVDPGLKSIESMTSLALEFNKVPASRVTTTTIPFDWMQDPRSSDPNIRVPVFNSSTDQLFSMIANDIPLDKGGTAAPSASASPSPSPPASAAPVDKASVLLSVQNASSTQGRGQLMANHLVAAGFTKAVRDTSNVSGTTLLSYPAADKAQADAVAAALGLTPSTLKADSTVDHLVLRIGSDWATGYDFRSTLPKQGTLPSGTRAQNAASTDECMDVYKPYQWSGSTPPDVPQPAGFKPYTTP